MVELFVCHLNIMNNSVLILNNNRAIENGGGFYFTDYFAATFSHGSTVEFHIMLLIDMEELCTAR